eukprot:scaffold250610_cov30-Tisochrysis_lutea.AAC.5
MANVRLDRAQCERRRGVAGGKYHGSKRPHLDWVAQAGTCTVGFYARDFLCHGSSISHSSLEKLNLRRSTRRGERCRLPVLPNTAPKDRERDSTAHVTRAQGD